MSFILWVVFWWSILFASKSFLQFSEIISTAMYLIINPFNLISNRYYYFTKYCLQTYIKDKNKIHRIVSFIHKTVWGKPPLVKDILILHIVLKKTLKKPPRISLQQFQEQVRYFYFKLKLNYFDSWFFFISFSAILSTQKKKEFFLGILTAFEIYGIHRLSFVFFSDIKHWDF